MILQHITHLPYWSVWMRMMSKGSFDLFQICMSQHDGLHWLPLGVPYSLPKAHILLVHALKNTYEMEKEAWLRWLLLGEYG